MSEDRPLGWLADAQRSHGQAMDLWAPVEAQLRDSLADLREATFVICNVAPTDAAADNRKYLQYSVADDAGTRILVAEASALRYQGTVDESAGAQQALIDAMGWQRPDDGNHRRVFAWPHDLDEAVGDSMTIIRDVWGVTHPAQVSLHAPQPSGDASMTLPTGSLAETLEVLSGWSGLAGFSVLEPDEEDEDANEILMVALAGGTMAVMPNLEASHILLVGFMGRVAKGDAVSEAVVAAISDEAVVGALQRTDEQEAGWGLSLTQMVPTRGLSAQAFGQQLKWLALSIKAVSRVLTDQGVMSGD